MARYYADHARREQLAMLRETCARACRSPTAIPTLAQEIDRRIAELRAAIEKEPYVFDRRFLFRVLSMGHSQFAEFIGARGPNTQINAACASTTQAVSLAEDWIRAGRCRRVIVVSADDITSDHLIEWFGAGFLASGAAATDEVVEEAAIPFDRRRHGMIMGMGAAALVVESAEAAARTRHPADLRSAERGDRQQRLPRHAAGCAAHRPGDGEPGAPGRSAQRHFARTRWRRRWCSFRTKPTRRRAAAAPRRRSTRCASVFGDAADQIVIANTKGFTGHAMGTGIEDVVAVKALETGCVPPVANFKEVDPELGPLNLSKGGVYPVEYALRLGAGFGSQISMTLMRWVPVQDGARPQPECAGLRVSHRRCSGLERLDQRAGRRVGGTGSGAADVARAATEAGARPQRRSRWSRCVAVPVRSFPSAGEHAIRSRQARMCATGEAAGSTGAR